MEGQSTNGYATPVKVPNKRLQKIMAQTPAGLRSPAVRIPPTPFLEKHGYGTGVEVLLYKRTPLKNGNLKSPWVIKRVQKTRLGTQISDRLDHEAKVLKKLSHPNIIGYRGFKTTENGTQCLIMEDGHRSLFDLIEERNEDEMGEYSAQVIEKVVLAIAKALNYLHTEKGLMHGDLKSGNILIVGDFEQIKLCDFGVTLTVNSEGIVSDPNINDPNSPYMGTDLWAAPECIEPGRIITTKADIFSLGLVIYEMLSLEIPHSAPLDESVLEDSTDGEDSFLSTANESDIRALCGTRPSLPEDLVDSMDESYKRVLEVYMATTQENPKLRPSAQDLINLLEGKVKYLETYIG